MEESRIKEARLILRAHEQKKQAEKERRQREVTACNNCVFCKFIKGNFFRSSKYHCMVRECYITHEHDLDFLQLETAAASCPCFENKYK